MQNLMYKVIYTMEYIICALMIIITTVIIYVINASFEYNFKPKTKEALKFNILSGCVIVLVKENCPYCEELEEIIAKSNVKHTTIKLTNEKTFEFDNTFTNLTPEERNNIIKETQNIFIPGQTILFPTIIANDYTHSGLPQKDIISKIFNI